MRFQPNRLIRLARVAGGTMLFLAGLLLLVLPGPGVPLILGGLLLLESEFHWARRLRGRLVSAAAKTTGGVSALIRRIRGRLDARRRSLEPRAFQKQMSTASPAFAGTKGGSHGA